MGMAPPPEEGVVTMEWAEGTGSTLETAQQNAVAQLGVSADEVTFEVLSRPGTLGSIFGRAEFRVRAILAEPVEHGEEAADQPVAAVEAVAQVAPPAGPMLHAGLAEAAREMLQQMVDLMGLEGVAHIAESTEDEVRLNVEGEDMGLLIGRHGATLDAVQLVVAIVANRRVDDGARIIVDAEDYRERHQQMIEQRAHTLAEEAKQTGKEIVVPDLKAYERRIMHLALRDDPEVETYSEGEGDDRVLVISPVT